jgi:hypothetical protein
MNHKNYKIGKEFVQKIKIFIQLKVFVN